MAPTPGSLPAFYRPRQLAVEQLQRGARIQRRRIRAAKSLDLVQKLVRKVGLFELAGQLRGLQDQGAVHRGVDGRLTEALDCTGGLAQAMQHAHQHHQQVGIIGSGGDDGHQLGQRVPIASLLRGQRGQAQASHHVGRIQNDQGFQRRPGRLGIPGGQLLLGALPEARQSSRLLDTDHSSSNPRVPGRDCRIAFGILPRKKKRPPEGGR